MRTRRLCSRVGSGFLIPVFVLVCLAQIVSSAQELTTGVIEGVVTNADLAPLPDVTVTVAGPQGLRSEITDDAGRFAFRDLVPGSYTVKAEADGYAAVAQTDVRVTLGRRTQLPFALAGGVSERVTVTSKAPLIDSKGTGVDETISVRDFVEHIPLGRDFTSIFTLAPGVSSGLQSGRQNYSISGSSGLENSYLIDGVNITNSGYGAYGAYNEDYKSIGSGVTTDFIDQVEIKTSGFESDFGQAMGGVVNAIVKSGTNEFSGRLSAYASPDSFAASRKIRHLDPDAVSTLETERTELGFSLGGPLLRDRLFWFAAYNPVHTDITRIRTVEDDSVLYDGNGDLIDPDQPTGGRTETADRETRNFAAKLSWFVQPGHRLELTAFGDPAEGEYGAQREESLRRTADQGFSALDYGGHNVSLKYFGAVTSKLFVDAMWARHESQVLETAAPIYRVFDRTVPGPGGGLLGRIETGGLGGLTNTDERVDQIALKLTTVLGKHEIKLGYQRDEAEYTEVGGYSGPTWKVRMPIATFDAGGEPFWTGEYLEYESATGAYLWLDAFPTSPTGLSYLARSSRFDPQPVATQNEEQSFFFQDTWSVAPRWTLKLGVRWTDASIRGDQVFDLPFSLVRRSGFSTYLADPTQSLRFESALVEFPSEWAPRIGLAWDVQGNGKQKLYANYARYIQRMTQRLSIRALSARLNFRQRWADPMLSVPIEDGQCPVDDGTGAIIGAACHTVPRVQRRSVLDSGFWGGTRLPATDELLVGYSKQLGANMGLDVRYVHREIGRIIEDFSYVPLESVNNADWGVLSGFPFDPFPDYPADFFGAYLFSNVSEDSREAALEAAETNGQSAIADLWRRGTIADFPPPTRDYDALEVVFDKWLSENWLMRAAYRYARLFGNYEGLLRNDNGQDDPNLTSLYDFPNTPLLRGQFLNGHLNTDVEHSLQVYGSYLFPVGLELGAGLRWSSGTPRFPILWNPIYYAPEFPGMDPVYGSWWALGGDPNDLVLMLADGPGEIPNRMSNGSLDADGNLIFTDYLPGPTDQQLTNFWGEESFLYSYTPVTRQSGGRTPSTLSLDLHAAYTLGLGWRHSTLTVVVDAFNLFNRQEGVSFDDVLDQFAGTQWNPNFGRPLAFQAPRTLRLGLVWSF